jgi:hypothetical protein
LSQPAALDRLVKHELVHAIISSAAQCAGMAARGLASILEGSDRTWIPKILHRVTDVYPLDDLSGGFTHLDGGSAMVAYAESAIAAEILCARLGPNLGVFIQMVGNGYSFDQALATLNVAPETFHAEWRKRLHLR